MCFVYNMKGPKVVNVNTMGSMRDIYGSIKTKEDQLNLIGPSSE